LGEPAVMAVPEAVSAATVMGTQVQVATVMRAQLQEATVVGAQVQGAEGEAEGSLAAAAA
jgi:hypothetical protein